MIRIFVAYPLPLEWKNFILESVRNNKLQDKVRWTKEENLHITLFFIGEIEDENLDRTKESLGGFLSSQHSFELDFDSFTYRGKRDAPTMLWAQFRKNPAFESLNAGIFQAVKKYMTLKPAFEKPVPHCTLARLKPGADISAIVFENESGAGKIAVEGAELWRTIQSKEGLRYESLNSWSFLRG